MKHLNLILVLFVLVLTAACNSCQTSTAPIESVKVESSTNVQTQDMDCSNIVINADCPINECGILKGGYSYTFTIPSELNKVDGDNFYLVFDTFH